MYQICIVLTKDDMSSVKLTWGKLTSSDLMYGDQSSTELTCIDLTSADVTCVAPRPVRPVEGLRSRDIRIARTIGVIFVAFLVCCTPVSVVHYLDATVGLLLPYLACLISCPAVYRYLCSAPIRLCPFFP